MTLRRLCTAIVLPVIMLFIVQASFAQDKTVTGKVTDSKDGAPIAGVSVTAKGSNTGTQSGADGTFRITVPASATSIIFSAVGFGRAEVPISGTTADAILVSTSQNLNEVVVVGYGTARRKDLTGAVATVKEKDFNRGVITAPDQLIQGKAAGVLVINNTGQPGGATTIRIRGSSSIRSSNQPLFVVDGVPLSGGSARPSATGGGDYSSDGGNPLNFINPNDIASMEILKDASATAVYGSRGANGVVLVTTKRGQLGVPYVDVSASVGVSNVLKKLEVLDAGQFKKALGDYNIANQDFGSSSDAWDAITREALTQNYNAAFGGGNENARYRFSAGFLDQQGVVENSEFKKYNAAFNSSFKFLASKRLGLDFNVIVSQTNEELPPVSNFTGFTGNLISQALQWNPTLDLKNADGSLKYLGGTTINPLASLAYYEDRAKVNTVLVSVAPSFKITKDLEYKFLYSVNAQGGTRKGMVNRLLNLQGIQDVGVAYISNNEQTNQQLTHTLSYNKQITSNLNINAVAGYEWLIFDYRGNSQSGRNFQNLGLKYYDIMGASSPADRAISSYSSPNTELQSYFVRGIVNWRDRFILTATFRSDGSTKFGENNKYGYFPSFGLAWNIANEDFMKSNQLINNLKLRAGYGETGNQEFPSGASLDRYSIGYNSVTRQNFANPDLKWETSTTTNIGLDFAILDNRISGSVDWFNKKTSDVLFETTIASPAPTTGKIWKNIDGEVVNKGVEVSLLANVIRSQNLNWNIGGNVSFLDNTVTGLAGFYETGDLRGQGFSDVRGQRVVSGQPINVWYLQQYEGIDKATGQSIYGNDGQKDYSGSPNPTTLLGISSDLTWGKFFAGVNFNGTFGHYLFNNTAATVLSIGNLNGGRNVAQSVYNGEPIEAVSNSASPSTRYLEKGNYLKLANATISYRLGNLGKSFRNVNISLTGQNLFILTDYTGFDPEVNTDAGFGGIPSLGVEYIPYPSARTVLLGVTFSL